MKIPFLLFPILFFLGIHSNIPTDPYPPSSCPECKSVTGSGPLTGEYFLVDTEEPQCVDGCAYSWEGYGNDRYCFIKEDGLYTATECEKTLPATETPFMKVITNIIEENGEIYEQVDSYNNETGEVSIEVPPHGDREPLKIMMDPIGDTLVAKTLSKCQLKSIPDGVTPHSLASSGDEVGSRDEAITEDTEDVNHSITIEIAEATPEDLEKLSAAAYSACGDKKVVLTEEKDVTAAVFETLKSGGIIDFGPGKHRRKRDLGNCSSTRMCGARTSGCWRWPYGTSFSIHHLNMDVLCVECCQDEGSTSEMCLCSSITSLERLEQCTKPDEGNCPEGFYSCDGQCMVEVGAPSEKCNGSCPESRVPCGDLCIPSEWSSSLYDHYKQWVECSGHCVRGNVPCNGICPDGKTACGNRCVENNYADRWYTVCDGLCITKNMPCNGICEDGKFLCGEVCRQDDGNWRTCNGRCIYKTEACNGMCPMDGYLCGNSSRCITADDKSFQECNGDCIPFLTPCNNICPNGTISCGAECIEEKFSGLYKECNGHCLHYRDSCNGECPERMLFCPNWGNECVYDDGLTYFCGDSCIKKSQTCNGTCSDGWISCVQDYNVDYYGEYDGNYPECIKNGSSMNQYKICNETCIYSSDSCDGKCQDGYYNCDDWNQCLENHRQCNNQCPEGWEQCGRYECMKEDSPYSPYQSCGNLCIGKYEACNDTCAEGMEACGDWNPQSSMWRNLCYNAESINQPCNGICLTNGTACEGHCPDGFTVCTLGDFFYHNQQVCYNDSDQSKFTFNNGYCWFKYALGVEY